MWGPPGTPEFSLVTLIGWLQPINTGDSPRPYSSSLIGYGVAIVLHSLKTENERSTFYSARGWIG